TYVAKQADQLGKDLVVHNPVLLDAGACESLKLRRCQCAPSHSDDGDVEDAPSHHALQRGENLLAGKVPGRSKKDEGVGRGRSHGFFSSCPPNAQRWAERILSAKSALPREENRSYSAEVR